MQLLPLTSLVAAMREVRALVGAHSLPRRLLEALLQPRKCGSCQGERSGAQLLGVARMPAPLRKHMAAAYNDAQQAVRCAPLRSRCADARSSVSLVAFDV